MASITPALIKELRDRTGVGMGKCKEALEEAAGDIELAIANLRKSGMASAVKKEGRETKEGMIGTAENDKTIAVVEINAETDFVAKNDRFKEFVANIASEIAMSNPPSLDAFLQQAYSKESSLTIDQYRATIVQTIGENIQIRRLATFQKAHDKSFGIYSHLGGKIVTMAEISGSDDETGLAKDIGMHIAAAAPDYLSSDKVPLEIIENEKDIARVQVQGKPANIVEKIVQAKVDDYYGKSCLISQKYIRDDSLTIGDLVQKRAKEIGKPLAVIGFIRWSVGE